MGKSKIGSRLLKYCLTVLLTTLCLFLVGLGVSYFMGDSQTTLQDILFYVGAAPIALFSIGFFGDFFGKGSFSFQMSRSVSEQTPLQRSYHDEDDSRSRLGSNVQWICSGLLLWLISYFL